MSFEISRIIDFTRVLTVFFFLLLQMLYANDGQAQPTELGSCQRIFYFDENREDFNPTLGSTIRVTHNADNTVIDLDPRNTQRWQRCILASNVARTLPLKSSSWRSTAYVGMVANTGSKRTRYEVTSLRVFPFFKEAGENSAPVNASDADRALIIAHHLEHGLFDIKDTIEKMVEKLSTKAQRDAERIAVLEDSISHGAYMHMAKRLADMEQRLTGISDPILNSRVRRVEGHVDQRLKAFERQTSQGSRGWIKPFIVVALMVAAFAFYSYREFKAMNKWNNVYM